MWGHPKHCNSWRASPTLSRSFRKRSGNPTWHSAPESWWKCRTFRDAFASDPDSTEEKFKAELDRLENLGVLAKIDEPTAWVSSVVIATKKSGALRICIDPRPLNQAFKRETHQLPILDDLMPELARAKIFLTVDLTAGYWLCVLDDESSPLTTFATPFGRYWWKRLPFGLSASSEIFQKRVSQAIEGLEGILNITDDILVYGVGDTEDEARRDHDSKLEALLLRCRERGIALKRTS